MEIIFNKLYKIDISRTEPTERPEYQNIENFIRYIHGILEQIGTKTPERYYKFNSEHTEVRSLLNNILINNEYTISSLAIAKRLLIKESEAQDDLNKKKLKIDILKGMLIVSLVKMTEEATKLIILKVDYDEFLSEMTGDIITGLSIRKKVYKAFICELNNNNEILNTSVYDTNTPVSTYWWKHFLELEVEKSDEENTKIAFEAIEKDIINPLKTKFMQDYLHLWNLTVAHFRSEGEFNLLNYKDDIIGRYEPFDSNLKIDDLKAKVEKLPQKYKFDSRFNKIPKVVNKRFKKTITLTNEISLVLLHDVPNIKKTFKSHEDVDGKYLMIRSDIGYNYAKKIEENNKNE